MPSTEIPNPNSNSNSTSDASSSGPSFLETLSAMLTAAFDQTTTSQLTYTTPPRLPPHVPKDQLDTLGLETGIKLLQDHVNFVRLNPIVTDCHAVRADSDEGRKLHVPKLLADFAAQDGALASAASPTDTESYGAHARGWTHYSVTDQLPHPFGLPGTTVLTYTIALRNVPDGIESLVAAAGGVTIHGGIRVLRAAEGRDTPSGFRDPGPDTVKLWLQERAEVRCWVGTAWYVGKTLRESHESAHERFRAWWEREVRMRLSRMGLGQGQGQGQGMGLGTGLGGAAPGGSALGQ